VVSGWRKTWIWGLATTLLGGLFVVLACIGIPLLSVFVGRKRAFMIGARIWTRAMLGMGGASYRRLGWEALPEDIRTGRQPAIFMSNHESHLDPAAMMSSLEVDAVFIAKRELKWVPFLGQLIWFMDFIFINRQNRSKAIESLRQAAARIRKGQNVVIFPEGTRTPDGHLQDFKKGGFALARDAGVPIVPVALRGGFAVLPKGARSMAPGRYTVIFGTPVQPELEQTRETLMEEVRARISALVAQADALP
jgi:1-acyl-sn-glycerol-3-phosphate acyltransferase